MKIRKAIIPAAGMGTRVLPASKAVPKEMLNIVDKPAIQYIVEEAFKSGIEEVLVITETRALLRIILTVRLSWRQSLREMKAKEPYMKMLWRARISEIYTF